MRAAVVTSFDAPPEYEEVPAPVARGEDELLVDVLAAGLHPRVRSQAGGSHYTSTGVLPLVPGVDGVGRDPDGRLRYFVLPDTTLGSMAERTLIDPRRSVVLDDAADPVAVAAAMNPAMSSWVALRRRIAFAAGQSVLVLGATGNAGRMAVPIARHLGAARVVAAARDATKLSRSDASDTVVLDDAERLAARAADVDVVIDYLWGEPAAAAMVTLVAARPDRAKPLTWIQIGSVAGPTAPIPSAALRASRLQIVGSGQGSVPTSDLVAELSALAGEIARGTFAIDARAVPLADVRRAWGEAGATAERVVLVP
ncbi:MAG TPA: zinc-binding alcohol dehydrogenase family protein [Baekduia sp.]|uniref:zinc-binding alcohol dehydrogenase family protein n=1 Tax=Baekduia sp. TaxID=2600305 RepID=UPI002D79AB9E|nr:zinc-binding alcohol dehydrogenase family protein [Baekduia sp.]HET6505890.1 zinc-binding alcohol dehydrogenase family protein [Baekduia sp.]